MIICITPNPAIDRTIILPSLILGEVHRAERSIVSAGGKGLNVARAIHTLGGESLCMGFAGGHSGHLLADLAQDEGLNSSWTSTDSETRTCIILISQNSDATLINERGNPISMSDWKRLQEDVHNNLTSAGLVCISGSLPPNSSVDNLLGLLDMLLAAGQQVWVDTSGSTLDKVLTYSGICIKVNGDEIGKSLGFEIKDVKSAKRALEVLHERDLKACAITLGPYGALLATNEGRWYAQGPHVRVVSTVGSGDSFLGGLVSALDARKDWPESLANAVAAGTANALSAGGGRFTRKEFEDIRWQVQIQTW